MTTIDISAPTWAGNLCEIRPLAPVTKEKTDLFFMSLVFFGLLAFGDAHWVCLGITAVVSLAKMSGAQSFWCS
jgi:hypothetical protein